MNKFKPSINCIELIKKVESCVLIAYQKKDDVPTIGYGHTKGVKLGMEISQEEANFFLLEDAIEAGNYVNRLVKTKLNQNQFDALTDFVFNFGATKFNNSTLLKLINVNPNDGMIADQFIRWKYWADTIRSGLIRRRALEIELYFR